MNKMNKEERSAARALKMDLFKDSAAAQKDHQIFGLPFSVKESEVVLVPVPWEVTVSFRPGTANGPEAICEASRQIDLYNPICQDAWKYGFAMEGINEIRREQARHLRNVAADCIHYQTMGGSLEDPAFKIIQDHVNNAGRSLNIWLKEKALVYLRQGKLVGVVGGDHSVPLGLMHALAEHHGTYGILHIDAHYDQRDAFEGFEFSHASIMRNASRIREVEKIVHVGIRDYCREEHDFVVQSGRRIETFTDWHIACDKSYGRNTWNEQCQKIIANLPTRVYISFDIDGLDPSLCSHTGTPVPGGLGFNEACFLLEHVMKSGRTIIGFDLCEVAPANENDFSEGLDANVGARILYHLCSFAANSMLGVSE